MRRRFVIDLDGTLCDPPDSTNVDPAVASDRYWRYEAAVPKKKMIKKVNDLHALGHEIVIFTARGMETFSGDVKMANAHYRELTLEWLLMNGVKYDELIIGKPKADYYVDDKGMSPSEFLEREF